MREVQRLGNFVFKLNAVVNKPRFPWGYTSKEMVELEKVCQTYEALVSELDAKGETLEFDVKAYRGQNKNVLNMLDQLKDGAGKYVHQIILQGSLATNEEIDYSDFDALVILEEEAFTNAKTLKETIESLWDLYRNIINQDILQHHGWFVTTQKLLNTHLDHFFPAAIFSNSVVLAETDYALKISLLKDESGYRKALENTSAAIITEIESGSFLKNTYHLKSFLSKYMLLPSLYLQAKNSSGVYKKESFALASEDFTKSEWTTMDFVSDLRSNWEKPRSKVLTRIALLFPSLSRVLSKRFATSVSKDLQAKLNEKRSEMLSLVQSIRSKANARS